MFVACVEIIDCNISSVVIIYDLEKNKAQYKVTYSKDLLALSIICS